MAYNPAFPVEHTEILAEQFRDQFHGIVDLIQAAPPGPPGPPGPGTVVSVTGGIVDNTDPANPVIRTDVIGGAAKLVEGDRIPAGATNHFLGADVSGSNGFANPN